MAAKNNKKSGGGNNKNDGEDYDYLYKRKSLFLKINERNPLLIPPFSLLPPSSYFFCILISPN